MLNGSDIIFAPSTGQGGAISVVRLSGAGCLSLLDGIVRLRRGSVSEAPGYSLRYGSIEGLDEVIVSIFRAPHSYTGEDMAEVSCHGSQYIVNALLERLSAAGARLAEPGEFTQRAFVAGKMDLAQAEAVADLISSVSSAQHRVAFNQLRGGYSAELAAIRAQLVELSSLLELELDFSEEEVEFADRSKLQALALEASQRCSSLADSFRVGNAVRNGVPVAIVGAPNSGKSTLLNALLREERAIVSDVPGTTRDTVEETCVVDGILFRFIDTAGLRESSDVVERLGMERTRRKAAESELVLWLIDASLAQGEDGFEDKIRGIQHLVDLDRQKLLILLNKIDKTGDNNFVKSLNSIVLKAGFEEDSISVLPISAKFGTGLPELRSKLVSLVGDGLGSAILVTSARHAAALRAASSALEDLLTGLSTSLPGDLLAEHLREALTSLGSITGEISSDEVLGEIFGRFCIGK